LRTWRPCDAIDFRVLDGKPLLAVFSYDRPPECRDANLVDVARVKFDTITEMLRWLRQQVAEASEEDTQTIDVGQILAVRPVVVAV